MLNFLELSNHTLFFYYVVSNGIYFLLLLIAIQKNIAHRHRLGSIRLEALSGITLHAAHQLAGSGAQ